MKNKEIPQHILGILADKAIAQEAEADNIEIGHALKGISEQQLQEIVSVKKPKILSFKEIVRKRMLWSLSMAAMLAIAIIVPLHVERQSMNKIDRLIYAYNSDILPMPFSVNRGTENGINISELSDSQLKESLPALARQYKESANNQDIAINGQILSLAYIRLHERDAAKDTLQSMIERLSSEKEDYQEVIDWCHSILNQLK